MNAQSDLIAEVLKIPGFADAVKAATKKECETLIACLRSCIEAGDLTQIAIIEGKIRAFEDVPDLLSRFAANSRFAATG